MPAGTPPKLIALLKRCLQKDPKSRLRDFGDVRFELADVMNGPPTAETGSLATPTPIRHRAVPVAAAVALTALVVGYGTWSFRPEPLRLTVRAAINLSDGEQFTPNGRVGLAISPSGDQIVYTANGRTNLRTMNQLEAVAIRGTEAPQGASFSSTLSSRNPSFSPDGRWIGFWQAGELKKVPVVGGVPITLTAAAQPFGVTWGADDMIVFSQGSEGIMRISAAGGVPEVLIAMKEGEFAQGPQVLPGGDATVGANRRLAPSHHAPSHYRTVAPLFA